MENKTNYEIIDNVRVFKNLDKKVRFNGNILYIPTATTRELNKDGLNVIYVDGNKYTLTFNKVLKMFECDNTKTENVDTLQVFRPSKCDAIQLTEKADKELVEKGSLAYKYKGKNYIITLDENGNAHANGEKKHVIAVFTN